MTQIYYGVKDAEGQLALDQQQVVENLLDSTDPREWGKVEIYEYVNQEMGENEPDPSWALECVLESLWDEYGNPEDYNDPATPKMLEAAREFCRVIREEYTVWVCRPNGNVDVVDLMEEWKSTKLPDETFEEMVATWDRRRG